MRLPKDHHRSNELGSPPPSDFPMISKVVQCWHLDAPSDRETEMDWSDRCLVYPRTCSLEDDFLEPPLAGPCIQTYFHQNNVIEQACEDS